MSMPEIGSGFMLEAPNRFWRALGASTLAIVNMGASPQGVEQFGSGAYPFFQSNWTQGEARTRLQVTSSSKAVTPFAQVSTIEAQNSDGVHPYQRYLFVPDLRPVGNRGFLAVFSGVTNSGELGPAVNNLALLDTAWYAGAAPTLYDLRDLLKKVVTALPDYVSAE